MAVFAAIKLHLAHQGRIKRIVGEVFIATPQPSAIDSNIWVSGKDRRRVIIEELRLGIRVRARHFAQHTAVQAAAGEQICPDDPLCS